MTEIEVTLPNLQKKVYKNRSNSHLFFFFFTVFCEMSDYYYFFCAVLFSQEVKMLTIFHGINFIQCCFLKVSVEQGHKELYM